MKLTEKMEIAVRAIKKISVSGEIDIDELGTILRLGQLINAYRNAKTLKLEHGDIDIENLDEFTSPVSISSDLKLLF